MTLKIDEKAIKKIQDMPIEEFQRDIYPQLNKNHFNRLMAFRCKKEEIEFIIADYELRGMEEDKAILIKWAEKYGKI